MTTEIATYKKHYEIYVKAKNEDWYEIIDISSEWWPKLMEQLNEKDFVLINWDMYNKYEILKVKKFEQKLSATQIEALEWKREIDEKRKELGLI